MRLVQCLCLIVGLAFAAPAQAHWQNTRWGMNEAEVRAVWPMASEIERADTYFLEVPGPVAVGGVTYESIRFTFDTKGRLRRVSLTTTLPFEDMRRRMISQFGSPAKETNEPFALGLSTRSVDFRDTGRGNLINLFATTGGPTNKAFVTYTPLETGF